MTPTQVKVLKLVRITPLLSIMRVVSTIIKDLTFDTTPDNTSTYLVH